ncbi:MAG: hypothetical protein K0U66_01735, partial [Gammaproteobacteria bacterium]|nr:hypothetical protein [Gammaproteobacteria bacterium]
MMEKEKHNSFRWIETIEKIVIQFHSTCSSLVSYHPGEFKKLPNTYKSILKEIKNEMGNDQQNRLIDRHKIIAGYIKAIMVLKIFTTKSIIGKNPKFKEKLPNEYLCLAFLVVITHTWGRDEKKYEGIKFKTPKKYSEDFAKMLY